jgi:hypothetical protein
MHAHFYRIAAAHEQRRGPQLEDADDDDHDAVWSVDSFTLVPTAVLTWSVPARTAAEFFVRPVPVAWVDTVEQRGHDPPQYPQSPAFLSFPTSTSSVSRLGASSRRFLGLN